MDWKLHLPLTKVIIASTVGYAMIVALLWNDAAEVSLIAILCLFAGLLYTHLFEYFYHSVAMHRPISLGGRRYYDKRHQRHHQIFAGKNFRNRNPEHLREVATSWFTFPLLLALHCAVFLSLFPAAFAPWFFLGVTLQFLTYEITHWCIHLEGNALDRALDRIPLLARLRAAQVRHHEKHHAVPSLNFNFTPPYLGDRWGRTHSR
jgi:hypothetical protein